METVTEYAKRLDVTISLVYYWIKKDRLEIEVERGVKKIVGFPDRPYIKEGGRPKLAVKNKQYKNRLGKLIQRGSQGDIIREWDSVKEASKFFGRVPSAITMVINKPDKKSCGFIWTREDK